MKHLFAFLLISLSFISISQTSGKIDVFNIYFDVNSFQLTPKGVQTINEKLYLIKDNKIEIKGYADYTGNRVENLKLSQKRADNVKQFLINNGVQNDSILSVKALGEDSTYNDLSKNRRVEIIVHYPIQQRIVSHKIVDTSLVTQTNPSTEKLNPKTSNDLNNLVNLKVGETLVLRNIQFYPGKDIPLPKAIPELKKLVKIMEDHPTLKIEIQGHICCTKCDRTIEHTLHVEKSNELSIRRARYVYYFLKNSGINKKRLSYMGFGSCKPKVAEINENAMQMNRRVEIMVIEK